MKDSRKGEALWSEWEGYNFPFSFGDSSLIFYTEDHVDIEHEVVKRALASTLQRDGIVSSLNQGFNLIDSGKITQGYAGSVDSDIYLTICDEDGITDSGDLVDDIIYITFAEVEYP